jgi:hypothetical protein
MWDRIIGKLGEVVSRRGLLGRAASACSAVALAICGFPTPARAYYSLFCCILCTKNICGNLSLCSGTWCWSCQWKRPGGQCVLINCVECYTSSASSTCFNSLALCPGSGTQCSCDVVMCSEAYETDYPCSSHTC